MEPDGQAQVGQAEAGREDEEGSLCQALRPLGLPRGRHGADWPGLSPRWAQRRAGYPCHRTD